LGVNQIGVDSTNSNTNLLIDDHQYLPYSTGGRANLNFKKGINNNSLYSKRGQSNYSIIHSENDSSDNDIQASGMRYSRNSIFTYAILNDYSEEDTIIRDNHYYLSCLINGFPFRFLTDTGASVSLIKIAKMQHIDYKIDHNDKIVLKGLGANMPINTAGSCLLNLSLINNEVLKIKFHVVSDPNSNIPFDGIIGTDFLSPNGALIDLNNLELNLKCLTNPIKISDSTNHGDADLNYTYLQPRSETVISISVQNKVEMVICPEI